MKGRVTALTTESPLSRSVPDGEWHRTRDAFVRRTPRSMVVAPRGSGEPVRIEGAAVTIWDALETPRSTPDLVDLVAGRFGVARVEIAGVVVTALDALESMGVVALA